MTKTVALIALIFALVIGSPAKLHSHPQEMQEKIGAASDSDAWRHYLLHVATLGLTPPPPPPARPGEGFSVENPWESSDVRTITNTAKKFQTEFEKSIKDFNASQENRIEADQIAALDSFVAQRDASVESYKNDLLTVLTTHGRAVLIEEVEKSKSTFISASTKGSSGENCGIPDHITCSLTFSTYPLPKINADYTFSMDHNQILDGAAMMVGNSQHARHTPMVTLVVTPCPTEADCNKGVLHSNSGESVCVDCYMYVNATVSVVVESPVKIETKGTAVCSETGTFFGDSSPE